MDGCWTGGGFVEGEWLGCAALFCLRLRKHWDQWELGSLSAGDEMNEPVLLFSILWVIPATSASPQSLQQCAVVAFRKYSNGGSSEQEL